MGTVHNFSPRGDNAGKPPGGGSEPPMELTERVSNLEADMREVRDRLIRVDGKMDSFSEHYATKADLHKEMTAQSWRIISLFSAIAGALVAATYFIAKHAG